MDPNYFRLDWERVFEVLMTMIVLSFLLERACALLFEHRLFVHRLKDKGWKEPIAFLVALLVCLRWDFDAVSTILLQEHTTMLGKFLTAGILAGGSKASIKLFHDVLDVKSPSLRESQKDDKSRANARRTLDGKDTAVTP